MVNDRINQVVNQWENQGFTCEIWTSPPGGGWSDPGHSTDEIFVLLEGEMMVVMGDKKYNLQIGEEFLVPAKEPHETVNMGEIPNRFYWIHKYHWTPNQKQDS